VRRPGGDRDVVRTPERRFSRPDGDRGGMRALGGRVGRQDGVLVGRAGRQGGALGGRVGWPGRAGRQGGALDGRVRRSGGDRGTVAMFTTIFAVFVLMLAGLLVDGGLTIHARQRGADIAEQAARAAADEIDLDELRSTGRARIMASDAPCRRARLLVAKYPEVTEPAKCAVSADRQTAYVTVRITVHPQLLGAFGFPDMTMTSSASAHPQEGV
jgi:Flp pilus assembly protein TadG